MNNWSEVYFSFARDKRKEKKKENEICGHRLKFEGH